MKAFAILYDNKPYMTALVGDLADRVNDPDLRHDFLFQSHDDAARIRQRNLQFIGPEAGSPE